ncbi:MULTISPECIES: D-alanyl-D-alanine carboxypeptidase family protein [Thermoactinomyces]|uniref:D-alanyl-D-alanine carboxypeptidase family protein n=1 Tax=Thermoactinomyces daqus TaxID=1329516 RepID=A0A7W2AGZ9_9BACL|nr:D-alanyl-D-alanine carboxypeptidase family protein [Thermoactinomyces daqus]MBA4542712.1 D-alanyl-D-alanine carboxypeptidase family protein [Thermoactinomyces daqus]MBH8597309.1 D-alanyl-D-alanine carboxypeptidase family protein [Thermoactinomyces sp. CICC 10523]MBH8602870.1 D-alanyl-D-alanine carboxypeptidase family protein [Thermoactinomyces sp. CICC 10522]MBH8607282.1 D-alanyl-D-alanine carboxypeptidase family protein [Thermoactinomyces sp. CICC 10521]
MNRYQHRSWQAAVAALGVLIFLSGCGSPIDAAVNRLNGAKQEQPVFRAIAFPTDEQTLAPGASYSLTLSGITPANRKVELNSDQVSYTVSNPEVAQVDSQGRLTVSKQAKTGSSVWVTAVYKQTRATMRVRVIVPLKDTIKIDSNGLAVVTNPADLSVVVNKHRSLPADYVPADLIQPNIPFAGQGDLEKKHLRKEAAHALEQLVQAAAKQNLHLVGISGYRSYARQKAIYENNVRKNGKERTSQFSAYPGQSEHETGLAIDVSSPSAHLALDESFGETKEGKWLAEHAAEYGFIIRYPKGKTQITGYAYEPWHIRYVGKEIAQEIAQKGITLEEYFQGK